MLADGQALRSVQLYVAGAKRTELEKTSKNGQEDARPVSSGETLKRLVGRGLLQTEVDTLRDHLLPHQLAVGVKGAVEVMPHLSRQWEEHFAGDLDRVELAYDEGNARIEVDRHAFLTRMRELCPDYMTRTTPFGLCIEALDAFDNAMKASFIESSGIPLDSTAWTQATLRIKQGGL
eukprot:4076597-Karenia_brevis.AAC.2